MFEIPFLPNFAMRAKHLTSECVIFDLKIKAESSSSVDYVQRAFFYFFVPGLK